MLKSIYEPSGTDVGALERRGGPRWLPIAVAAGAALALVFALGWWSGTRTGADEDLVRSDKTFTGTVVLYRSADRFLCVKSPQFDEQVCSVAWFLDPEAVPAKGMTVRGQRVWVTRPAADGEQAGSEDRLVITDLS